MFSEQTRCNLVLLFWWIYRAEAFSIFPLPHLQKTNLFTQQENLISTPVGHNREHKRASHTWQELNEYLRISARQKNIDSDKSLTGSGTIYCYSGPFESDKSADLKCIPQGWIDRIIGTRLISLSVK